MDRGCGTCAFAQCKGDVVECIWTVSEDAEVPPWLGDAIERLFIVRRITDGADCPVWQGREAANG